jgi:transcriptional antiterminator RfaH
LPNEPHPGSSQSEAWFCLRTHPKQEHVAAAQLRHEAGFEVFLPRIRYQRSSRGVSIWVTEALFQNYLFARFDLTLELRRVQHTRGVRYVVHFGDRWPAISENVIEELRSLMGASDLHVLEDTLQPGDPVQLVGGAIDGLQAIVTRILPAKERVAVLLEFLGRQTPLELHRKNLISQRERYQARLPLMWRSLSKPSRR